MSSCKEELERISKRINERAQAILDQNGVIFENEIDTIVREELGCESPYMNHFIENNFFVNLYAGMKGVTK